MKPLPFSPPEADTCNALEGVSTKQLLRLDGSSAGRALLPGDVTRCDDTHGNKTVGGDGADDERSKGATGADGAVGPGRWACSRCTLENPSGVVACEACGSAPVLSNDTEGYHLGKRPDGLVPAFLAETMAVMAVEEPPAGAMATASAAAAATATAAAAATAAAVTSSAKAVAVGTLNGVYTDDNETRSGTTVAEPTVAAGARAITHAPLLSSRARGRHVSLHDFVEAPSEPSPESMSCPREGRNSSLQPDTAFSPLTASTTPSLDFSPRSKPRCVNSSTSPKANEDGRCGMLSGTKFKLEPPTAAAGLQARPPAMARRRTPPRSTVARTPVLLPIPARKRTAPGGVLRGDVGGAPKFVGDSSPTVTNDSPPRIEIEAHAVPGNTHGSAPRRATRFEHPRKPQSRAGGYRRRLPRGDILTLCQLSNKTQNGSTGCSTIVRMRPRRLGGVERPPRLRDPRSSSPSDPITSEGLVPMPHSISHPKTVPELAATSDLFSRPLTLCSSPGLAASQRGGIGHRSTWRRRHDKSLTGSAASHLFPLRGEHGGSGSDSGGNGSSEAGSSRAGRAAVESGGTRSGGIGGVETRGSGTGSDGIESGSSGSSRSGSIAVSDAGGLSGAPVCDLSLSILGRSQGEHGLGMGPVIGAREVVGAGQVEGGEGKPRVPHEPARRVIGGSQARYDRGERVRRIGVAPSKLRHRVSDTRVLEPLHPA